MSRKTQLFIAALLAVLVCITACDGLGSKETVVAVEEKSIPVEIEKAQSGEIIKNNDFMGRVMPDSTVFVIPKVAGEVIKINVAVGDTVKKGQVLFEVDSTIDQLQLKQAEASLNMAKAGLEQATGATFEAQMVQLEGQVKQSKSQKKWNNDTYKDYDDVYEANSSLMYKNAQLLKKKMEEAKDLGNAETILAATAAYQAAQNSYDEFTAGYEAKYNQLTSGLEQIEIGLDMAEKAYSLAKGEAHAEQIKTIEAQLQQAEVGYEMAMQKLRYSSVTSPIDGVVENKSIELHGIATQSTPAFVITGKSALNVTFGVSAETASSMVVGDVVKVESGSKIYNAPIVEIAGIIDQQSGLFTVKAQIKEETPELLSGVAVKLTAITAKAKNSLVVDANSIYHLNNEAYVFVEKDGKAKRVVVKTGIITDKVAQIISGIKEGDNVIISWNPALVDGALVLVKQEV